MTTAKKTDMNNYQERLKRTIMTAVLIALVGLLTPAKSGAMGTAAGTLLNNTASASYTMGAGSYSITSNTNTIKVDEIVNITLVWQDALPGVMVTAGQTNRVLTMKLSNTGNAADTYTLSAIATRISTTDFTPAPSGLYLDANGNGSYDPGVDLPYDPDTNVPSVAPDQSLTIFLMGNIPATGLFDGQKGNLQLSAVSKTASGAPHAILSGKGPGNCDVVVGLTGGQASAVGTYVDSGIEVNVLKAAVVANQLGGKQPVPGATIHYTLVVTAGGSGTAVDVVITDPIPANTTYVAGSLKLDNAALSDAADADAGDENATTANTVTVKLGNMTSSTPARTIAFDVKIN